MDGISLHTAARLFFWSNALYVLGALLTLASAGLIVYERRSRGTEFRVPSFLLKESVILAPALVCLLGTLAAICFSGVLLNQQRASLETYRIQAAVEMSRMRQDSETETLTGRRLQPTRLAGIPPDADLTQVGKTIVFEAPAAAEAPRSFGPEPGLNDALRSYEGMRAVVESSASDGEATQLSSRLLLLLIANGIDARQGKDGSVLHQLVGQPGIHLRYKDANRGRDLAAALAQLLRGQGLHVDVAPAWELAAHLEGGAKTPVDHDQLLVSVGPKS